MASIVFEVEACLGPEHGEHRSCNIQAATGGCIRYTGVPLAAIQVLIFTSTSPDFLLLFVEDRTRYRVFT